MSQHTVGAALVVNSADQVIESAKIIREILNYPGGEEMKTAAFYALESIARPQPTSISNCSFVTNPPPAAKAQARKGKRK